MDEKMKKLQTARENMYRFLSRLYMFEVDDVCFKNLEKAVFPQHCGNEDMAQGYKILSDFFQSHPISDALLDELAADYAGTFLAAGAETYPSSRGAHIPRNPAGWAPYPVHAGGR